MKKKLTMLGIINGSFFALCANVLVAATAPVMNGEYLARSRGDAWQAFAFAVLLGLGAAFYLLPSYVAAFRNAPRFMSIFMLNLIAGWTGIGWIAAIIWAFVDIKKDYQIIVQQIYTSGPPPIPPQSRTIGNK